MLKNEKAMEDEISKLKKNYLIKRIKYFNKIIIIMTNYQI